MSCDHGMLAILVRAGGFESYSPPTSVKHLSKIEAHLADSCITHGDPQRACQRSSSCSVTMT
jgi:hypothetical protein